MNKFAKKHRIFINNFSLIFLIIFSIIKLSNNTEKIYKSDKNNISPNSLRRLLAGIDIIKKIDEQCLEDVNILKYNIILNSTAFLLNLNSSSRRSLYSSIKELDGKDIGIIKNKAYIDSIKAYFPSSKIHYYESINLLLLGLLMTGEIEAFVLEEPVAKYYLNVTEAITYFKETISKEVYGFGFSLKLNDKIKNEFNEYLAKIKVTEQYNIILEKWTGKSPPKTIDKNFIGLKGTIKAGFNLDVPPLAYKDKESGEIIGFEVDLLYSFAREYDYNVEISSLTAEEQINSIMNNNIDLVGGCFSITEQRKIFMNFSDYTYKGDTVLVVKNENKNVVNPNINSSQKKVLVKNNGVQNFGNILNFPVTGLPDGQTRIGSCVLPENLTEIYSFECSIPGLTENNPMINGFTYGLITDYIEVNGITLNNLYSFIPSHILGENVNNGVEHQGTICPKINTYLAGVDNIEETSNSLSLGFGLYRKPLELPKTQANLKIRKGSSSCEAICQEKKNIDLNSISSLIRYECSCTFTSTSTSSSFYADFDSIKFNYINDLNKIINMGIKNKEMTKSAMSNLYKNSAQFPSNLNNLNTFLVTKLINQRCLEGRFTFNAIGVIYKSISQEQFFSTNNPIRANYILKIPYDLEEAEIQISIDAKVRGVLLIRKDYYENENKKGEYLYLTSKDGVSIDAEYCEGTIPPINNPARNNSNTSRINVSNVERVEAITLRDEMSMPKWLIIFFVLLIAILTMMAIYVYIQKMDNETEYVIKYRKTQNTSNINTEIQPK